MKVQHRRPFTGRDYVIALLLCLATVHCVRSIFLVNVSPIDLQRYEHGTERMPFQGRVAMMPVLRWAHGSHGMQRVAAFFDNSLRGTTHFAVPPENVTPEKLACIAAGLTAMLLVLAFQIQLGRLRTPRVWWMPAVLFLFMLYITYAARYEAQYWYPYDLPHLALFGVAAICILEGWLPAAFCLFLLDLPMRETSVFLVPLVLATGFVQQKRSALGWAIAMVVLWLPVHLFATDARMHWLHIGRALANPLHWPQVGSAFGFLIVPFCFGFGFLTRKERWFVFAALPSLAVIALYGIWYETRVWGEWLLPFALLLSLEIMRRLDMELQRPAESTLLAMGAAL
jgi:hypothetical protein